MNFAKTVCSYISEMGASIAGFLECLDLWSSDTVKLVSISAFTRKS